MPNNIELTITERLADLSLDVFEFRDDSHLHIGHAGNRGGGHYAIVVVSQQFEGVSRLNRQRMIKERLRDCFEDGRIHALHIRAQTPHEFFEETSF